MLTGLFKKKLSAENAAQVLVNLIVHSTDVGSIWDSEMIQFFDEYGYMPYSDEDKKQILEYEVIALAIAGNLLAVKNLTPNHYPSVRDSIHKIILKSDIGEEYLLPTIQNYYTRLDNCASLGNPPQSIVCDVIFEAMSYPGKESNDSISLSLFMMSLFTHRTHYWKNITMKYKIVS